MPCLSTNAYYKQVNSILGVVENYSWEELLNASQKPRNIIVDDNQAVDETASAAVSLDGTWAKRGFSSLTGVFFAISVNTCEVLDYTALSKACQKRALKESQCEGDDKKFLGWRREHLATGECDINFNGSSPALEAEWAFILWRRSIELQKKKHYKWMVSNGDRKAFKAFENLYMLDWKLLHWIVLAMPKRECGCTFWT